MTIHERNRASAVVRNWIDELACPSCGIRLASSGERLSCATCQKSWPIVDGVPHFVDAFPYWGEIPAREMQEVNQRAAASSWRDALLKCDDPAVQKASEMILNVDRSNWHWLADLPAESRVLDLGAGTGTNSHGLGLRFADVTAVEPVMERIRFMQLRFAQEGLSNVNVLRSSLWILPFLKDSFDLVAMNGVLEWVATGVPGDPMALQKRALENVYNLVRPGGYFYLGIENRFNLGYFAGYPDPHCGLPWVTILPRPLADWYARRKGQTDGYRNYLYSSAGYRKLLQGAGFKDIEIYLALPTYNHPRFLVPLEDKVFDYYRRNFADGPSRSPRQKVLEMVRKTGLLKHCEYSFAILARK
jgi:SAM-dependent methyltransferase